MKLQGYGRTCNRGHKVVGDNVKPGRVPTTGKPYAECRACFNLQTRVPVDPEDGVECLICGDVLRCLGGHVKRHGITAREYRERFPGAPMAGKIHREIQRDLHDDRVSDGTWHKPKEKGVCKNGHKLTHHNTYKNAHGRQCKQCAKVKQREYHARKKAA